MSDPGPALKVILDALRDALARPDVRAALGDVGRYLVSLSESGTEVTGTRATPDAAAAPEASETPPRATAAPSLAVELKPSLQPMPIIGPAVPTKLRIGDSNPLEVVTRGAGIVSAREIAPEPAPPPPPARRHEEEELPDLKRVAASALLKAEACARAARGENTGSLRDQILALRAGEEAFDGGLWMCSWLDPEGRARASKAEPCYRALAAAAELGAFLRDRDRLHPGEGLEEPFRLMAQSQSMVRNFVGDGRGDDLDQLDMFLWLRTLTSEHRCRVRVDRYMRRNDVAPPEDAPGVLAVLASSFESWKTRLDGAKERRRLIGKVRHKAGLLAAGSLDTPTVWKDLERVFGDLAAIGVRPGDPEVVAALAGVPEVPAGFAPSEGLAEALRRARESSNKHDTSTDESDGERDTDHSSPEVAEAAKLLRGRVMLLIGGEVKPLRREAIEKAFGLRELKWIGANMTDASTDDFEPQLRRPETSLVVRMIRFTRTNHGELLDLCKRYSRPFVNLPAGYGVNQLAAEILAQAGEQLKTLPPVPAG